MKKIQGIDKEIKKLKAHLTQLKLNGKTRSMGVLLNQEATIRKKMKVVHTIEALQEELKVEHSTVVKSCHDTDVM